MAAFGCLERPVADFFYKYGTFVSNHPFPFIAFPLLLTMYFSTGFLHLDPLTDAVYLYTPTDAPSKVERQIIHDLWPLNEENYVPGRTVTQNREAQITVVARNDGNILLPEYTKAIQRLDSYIQNKIKVNFRNRTYTYKDLCLKWKHKGCHSNDHVNIISQLYNHGINITFPTFRMGSKSGYLGAALGGVTLGRDESGQVLLAGAKAWILIYQLKFYPSNVSYISGIWENTFKRHMDEYPPDPYIAITYFHSQTLAEELKRNADSLAPRFITAFVILIAFSVLCSLVTVRGTLFIDWALSKPIVSVLGVFNAGMGIASAMGILILLGIQYNDIVAVMPFLVVAVGTDNMFLMVAAVKKTSRALSTQKRMAECMAEAAVSILITALTDAFSFGVGTITTIPAVQIFCIYTGLALVLTFVYQVTFFCAVLSLATQWEGEGRHCLWLKPTIPPKVQNSTSLFSKIFWMGSRPHPDPNHKSNTKNCKATQFFQNWYAPILMQPVVKGLVIVWYFIYVGFAIYGCLHLKEGLEPVNLLVDDSYATPHYRSLEKHFWHYGATLQIVVNKAPDLREPLTRQHVKDMVREFANTKHSIGDESIQFWMNEMERYYALEVNTTLLDESFYQMAAHYLYSHEDDPWMEDVKWTTDKSGRTYIKAFRFLIGMRDISSTTQQTSACDEFRALAERFQDYNVTTFMPLWLFTDQYALVVPNTVQDIVIAVLCMLFIAFMLIPQPFCALWVAFTIGSIDLGVLGFMTLWGVNLDAISMITIIMSVGFSVDYSAHITYAYVVSKETDTKLRVKDALRDLGWPVVQGAASTIMAVAVLADVPAYMIVTFFKTVFLAISIGLIHGMLFLPLMLSLFVRGCCTVSSRHQDEPPTHPITSSARVAPSVYSAQYEPKGTIVSSLNSSTSSSTFNPSLLVRSTMSQRTTPVLSITCSQPVSDYMTPDSRFIDGFDVPSPPSFPPPPLPDSHPQHHQFEYASAFLPDLPDIPYR